MRRLLILITMIVMGVSVVQGADGWRVALLKQGMDSIGTLTNLSVMLVSEGGIVEEIVVPPSAIYPTSRLNDAIISPDMRYLVLAQSNYDTGNAYELLMVDLFLGTCCTIVGTNDDIVAFELGDFAPDMTTFSASYVGSSASDGAIFGGIFTINAALGTVENSLEARDFESAIGMMGAWGLMGKWTDAGIFFHPNCYACGGVSSGQWAIWQPNTGIINPTSGEYFDIFSAPDRLSTGESLLLDYDTRYFAPAGSADMYIPTANVVKYFIGDQPIIYGTLQDYSVVYADDGGAQITKATWVQNGSYYLVVNTNGRATLGGRDAITADYIFQLDPYGMLVGTPEGWIGISYPSVPASLVIQTATDIVSRPLAEFDYVSLLRPVVMDNFGTVPSTPFPTASVITPFFAESAPIDDTTPMSCSGFMPSRLILGNYGTVTPGVANNLRSQPSATSSRVGQMPAGSIFLVLDGPVCDATNGIAWWRVEYNGIQAWTAEGMGNEYFTSPLN